MVKPTNGNGAQDAQKRAEKIAGVANEEADASVFVYFAEVLSTHLAESNKQQLRLNKLTNRILLVLAVTMLAAVISAVAMLATFLWGEGILRP